MLSDRRGRPAINNNKLPTGHRVSVKRFLAGFCALLFALQQFSVAHAQYLNPDLDIDPPVIDHEALEVGVAGESQLFSALVIDDKGIEYVDLYHRSGANAQYQQTPMSSTQTSNQYTTIIPTQLGQTRIEYYIEAADIGGNRVLKGFPFFPLVRNLDVPAPVQPAVTAATSPKESSGSQSKLLYVLLGALAVGLLASASSSGDDSGPTTGAQVPLTINISSPTD